MISMSNHKRVLGSPGPKTSAAMSGKSTPMDASKMQSISEAARRGEKPAVPVDRTPNRLAVEMQRRGAEMVRKEWGK